MLVVRLRQGRGHDAGQAGQGGEPQPDFDRHCEQEGAKGAGQFTHRHARYAESIHWLAS